MQVAKGGTTRDSQSNYEREEDEGKTRGLGPQEGYRHLRGQRAWRGVLAGMRVVAG